MGTQCKADCKEWMQPERIHLNLFASSCLHCVHPSFSVSIPICLFSCQSFSVFLPIQSILHFLSVRHRNLSVGLSLIFSVTLTASKRVWLLNWGRSKNRKRKNRQEERVGQRWYLWSYVTDEFPAASKVYLMSVSIVSWWKMDLDFWEDCLDMLWLSQEIVICWHCDISRPFIQLCAN